MDKYFRKANREFTVYGYAVSQTLSRCSSNAATISRVRTS